MKKVKIIADSTCDLSKDLIEKYDIKIIPLCIIMGEKSYYDGVEVNPEEIFTWADRNKTTPKTAAVTMEKAREVLEPVIRSGHPIIFMGISTDMSHTCNVIRLVGEEMEYNDIHVIDSRNLSTGIGLQVLRAAEMAEEGCRVREIVKVIEKNRDKVRASFVVDTLTYLARGGRCSSVTALLANTIKLHPEIIVKDGRMSVSRKFRGSMEHVLLKYVKSMEADLLKAEKRRVFITHSGCSREIVEQVRDYIAGLHIFEEILETKAGGVISSHCGPGTLGVLFYES